ncbi:MAG: hypothetical protein KDE19_11855, partial [Caldilineaceae bacterium]|nr:hypothetical protein [Caldilineaceae bacterium]
MHRDTLAVQQEQSPPRLSTTSTPDKLQGAVLNATPKFAQRIQERFWPLALLRIISTIGLLLVGSWLLSGCANAPSTLQPQGPAAAQLATLWWVLFWVATAVFVIVMGMLAYALWRPRHQGRHKDNNAPEAAPNAATDSGGIGSGRLFVGIGGALIPALVLVG